mgnify:CR=1 FL=1
MAVSGSNLTVGSSATDATSYNTASVSPTSNNLVLVSVANSLSGTPTTPSLSGNGLTYVQVNTVVYDASGTQRRLTTFRALGASPSAGAITISFGATTQLNCIWVVDQFSGVDTSGTNGSGAVVQSATNSATSAPSALTVTLAAFGSANNATYGSFSWNDNANTATPGTGFSELNEHQQATEQISIQSQWRADNDTSVDVSLTGATGEIGGIAVEIKAATATVFHMLPILGVGQ